MAKEITSPQIREIVSFCRTELDDNDFKIFKTQDEIFGKIDIICKEIARKTYCLTDDLKFELIPDKFDYKFISVFKTPQVILRIDKVTTSYHGLESDPLIKVSQDFLAKAKSDTSVINPKYYDFDRIKFYIWKPPSVTQVIVHIHCSRLPNEGEKIGYDTELPITYIYWDYVKYGTAKLMCASRPELMDRAEYYHTLYKEFETVKAQPTSSERTFSNFNELNL